MRKIKMKSIFLLAVLMGILLLLPAMGNGQDVVESDLLDRGIFIKLTEDFYHALREESDRRTTTYSTDRSDEYLRQIAVSAKFMVETNLHILKQQDTIIRLLESLNKKRK